MFQVRRVNTRFILTDSKRLHTSKQGLRLSGFQMGVMVILSINWPHYTQLAAKGRRKLFIHTSVHDPHHPSRLITLELSSGF